MTPLQKTIKYCAVVFGIILVVAIISGICGAVGLISSFFDGDDVGEMKTYDISGSIESLDIDVGAASLSIVTGDSFSVESDYKYLSVKDNNGILKISQKKMHFGIASKGASIVLTVPEGYVFEEVVISTGAGKMTVDELSTNTLKLDLGAGEVDIGCLNVSTWADISGGTGKIAIQDGEINNLDMDMGVGKLELTAQLTGNCDMDCGVGDAELNLLGSKEDYTIEIDKGVGSAKLDGKNMADDSEYGTGVNKIEIDGGVGAVEIRFKEKAA